MLSDSKNSDSGQNNSGLDSAAGQTENSDVLAVPLVSGFELNNVKEGKKAESGDSDKFNKMYELCRALKSAELLNRTTYINVENLDDITVVIENRLEVQRRYQMPTKKAAMRDLATKTKKRSRWHQMYSMR